MNETVKQTVLGLLFWLAFAPLAIVGILALPVGILLYAFGNTNIRDWVYRAGKALDQLDNALFFGGLPQETISSHVGRYILSGEPMPLHFHIVDWLTALFEKGHCVKAIEPPFVGQPL